MEYSTGQRFNLSNVLFLVLLWITSGAFAGPLEDAATAFKHGDYSTAMALWRPLAEEGNAAVAKWSRAKRRLLPGIKRPLRRAMRRQSIAWGRGTFRGPSAPAVFLATFLEGSR